MPKQLSTFDISGRLLLTGAAGTSGQVLTSGGSGTTPTWTTITGGYTLPTATATTLGGIELFSATTQTTAANAVTTTASRTYGLQLNSDLQGVVNVPWADTFPSTFTYTAGTTSGPTGSLTGSGMSAVSFAAIPSASGTASGIVTTGSQTFAGEKTFTSALTAGESGLGGSYQLQVSGTQAGIRLTNSNDTGISWIDFNNSSGTRGNIYYSHSTNTLNFGTFSGSLGDRVSITSTGLETKASTAQYPVSLNLLESSHATSRRTAISLGSQWQIGADSAGNGTRDFFLYGNGAQRFGISTAGVVSVPGAFNLSSTTAPLQVQGSAGTSGQVLTSAGAGVTPTWTTVSGGSFTGGTLTSGLVLATGTTSLQPLKFVAGTNLTTPVTGVKEYDGTVFYQTSDTNPGRALSTQNYYYVSSSDYIIDYTGSGASKSMLGAATRGITVAAGTTYEYELFAAVRHQYAVQTGITGTYQMTNTGGATVAHVSYVDYGSNTTGFTTATTMSSVRDTGNTLFMAAISSGSRYAILKVRGVIRVTGSGTTKIYPGLSASAANDNTWTISSGLIFKMTPVGNGTVTSVGTWA
jgi:hypothetical protein